MSDCDSRGCAHRATNEPSENLCGTLCPPPRRMGWRGPRRRDMTKTARTRKKIHKPGLPQKSGQFRSFPVTSAWAEAHEVSPRKNPQRPLSKNPVNSGQFRSNAATGMVAGGRGRISPNADKSGHFRTRENRNFSGSRQRATKAATAGRQRVRIFPEAAKGRHDRNPPRPDRLFGRGFFCPSARGGTEAWELSRWHNLMTT